MNPKIISAIAFRLFAIYVLVSAIIALPTIFGAFVGLLNQPTNETVAILWPFSIAGATIAIALIALKVLWGLGNKVLNDASELDPGGDLGRQSLEKTLFLLLGTYFAVSAVVDVPTLATTFWIRSHAPGGITMHDYAWLLSVIGQFLIGLHLIARLDKWLLFFRYVGHR